MLFADSRTREQTNRLGRAATGGKHMLDNVGSVKLAKEGATAQTLDLRDAASSISQRYLFGFAPRVEVAAYLRNQACDADRPRIDALLEQWQRAQASVLLKSQTEAGVAEGIRVAPLPADLVPLANDHLQSPEVKGAFGNVTTSIAMVEVDKLIVGQRSINLDYVSQLKDQYAGRTSPERLVDYCLGPASIPSVVHHIEPQPGVHVFSSLNPGLRVLGSFIKQDLTDEDAELAANGGDPVKALVAFVGFGVSAVSVYQIGARILLNNGHHRLYALRGLGVTEVPALIQHISNPALEMPPVVVNVARDNLLGVVRPPMLLDYFNEELAVTIGTRRIMQVATLITQVNMLPVPA